MLNKSEPKIQKPNLKAEFKSIPNMEQLQKSLSEALGLLEEADTK